MKQPYVYYKLFPLLLADHNLKFSKEHDFLRLRLTEFHCLENIFKVVLSQRNVFIAEISRSKHPETHDPKLNNYFSNV